MQINEVERWFDYADADAKQALENLKAFVTSYPIDKIHKEIEEYKKLKNK